MSTNCLVTKLKSSVSNDTLEVLGQLKVFVEYNGSGSAITLRPKKAVTVDSTDTLMLSGENHLTVAPNTEVQLVVSGSGNILIDDKYSIEKFQVTKCKMAVDIEKFTYMPSLRRLVLTENETVYGNIENILNTNALTYLQVPGYNITGDLSKVDIQKLSNLTYIQVSSENIYGNISLFSNGSLTEFNFNNCKNIVGDIASVSNKQNFTRISFYNSGITGALESYVDSAIQSGKTTAENFSMTGAISQLTFGGIKQSTAGLTTVASCFVSWDNTGKISVLTGAYNVANTTHVFCKGYTQEEAETAFQGKTIIRVDA